MLAVHKNTYLLRKKVPAPKPINYSFIAFFSFISYRTGIAYKPVGKRALKKACKLKMDC